MYVLGLVVLGLPIFLAANALVSLLLRLDRLPRGIGRWTASGLVTSLLLGGLLSWSAFAEIVRRPASYQAAHLGAEYGTPFNLVSFSLDGFQDVLIEWQYRLSRDQADALRARCKGAVSTLGHEGCLLHGEVSGDSMDTLTLLLEGDRLWIIETA